MGGGLKESGRTTNKMVEGCLHLEMEKSGAVSGRMGKLSNGPIIIFNT